MSFAADTPSAAGVADFLETQRFAVVLNAQQGTENVPLTPESVFTTYKGLIRSALSRNGIRSSDIDDATQDVAMKILRKLHTLRNPDAVRSWLYAMVRRHACNLHHRERTPTPNGDAINWYAVDQDKPEDFVMTAEMEDCLSNAIHHLPAVDIAVINLFYFQGMSLNEMMDALDAPLGTVKRRLHTARRRLREQLEGSHFQP